MNMYNKIKRVNLYNSPFSMLCELGHTVIVHEQHNIHGNTFCEITYRLMKRRIPIFSRHSISEKNTFKEHSDYAVKKFKRECLRQNNRYAGRYGTNPLNSKFSAQSKYTTERLIARLKCK